jgi:MFS family permease
MTSTASPSLFKSLFNQTVIITALGYLVDVYDLILFNTLRQPSLADLGLSGDALTKAGIFILNAQQFGLIAGGLFWGILGDKMGRKASLLGSILLYSLASFGCAFVQDENMYAALRFITGLGLAGEIGIGVTLITEKLPPQTRAGGVALFAFIGIAGAVLAAVASEIMPWRTCYMVGGTAGIVLLFTRSLLLESGLFERTRDQTGIVRGNFLMILNWYINAQMQH